MLAGDRREVLFRVADRLSTDLGYPADEETFRTDALAGPAKPEMHLLNSDDELLVKTVRLGLARLAHGLGAAEQPEASQRLVVAALDGAEMTMRSDLMRGSSEHLPALLPSFVFLVALPVVQQDQAFELSRRTFELLEEVRREP